jgi:hypothetical protein
VKRITILDGLLRWKRSQDYVPEGKLHTKVMQEMHDVPMVEHCGEKTKKVVGENFLLAQNEGRHRAIHPHM